MRSFKDWFRWEVVHYIIIARCNIRLYLSRMKIKQLERGLK